jgi:hypothetical protein
MILAGCGVAHGLNCLSPERSSKSRLRSGLRSANCEDALVRQPSSHLTEQNLGHMFGRKRASIASLLSATKEDGNPIAFYLACAAERNRKPA